jgi:putative membrane protein
MKALMMAAGAAMLLAGCATTAPGDMADPVAAVDPTSPLSAPGYMAMAASSDMFEIESSRLALQRSRHPAVRQFAQMMIADHSRTSSEMMAIARELNLPPPPTQMMPHHMEMLDRLRMAGPGEFDSAYKREQVMAHEEALTLHRNYAEGGDAEPFRALASRAVPIIQAHWDHARSLPEQMMMEQQEPAPEQRRSGERG